MTSPRRLVATVALLALGACADSLAVFGPAFTPVSEQVSAEVLTSSASPGDVVGVRFVNRSQNGYWMNVCSRAVVNG